MNGYLFDQSLISEYSAYRMGGSLLLNDDGLVLSSSPATVSFSPASATTNSAFSSTLHHSHTSPHSSAYHTGSPASPWDIALDGGQGQQHPPPSQVTPRARDALPTSSVISTGFGALRTLNIRHRAQLRELIDAQDMEEVGAQVGVSSGHGPADDHSLRHSVALQELIVQLGTERDELLGQMVNEGRVESAAGLLSIDKLGEQTNDMSWSSEDSDVVPVQAASRPHDFSAIGSGFDTSPSSSWSNPGPVASRAAQGQDGLVFGAAMQRSGTMESSDDDLQFDFDGPSRRSSFGDSAQPNVSSPQSLGHAHAQHPHASFIQLPPRQKTSPRPKPSSSSTRSREPRVAFSCDSCAKMKKPCKKPLGADGLIDPIGDCVRCTNHGQRFGKPVHCTYLRSQDRIVKSRHQGQLVRDEIQGADVG